MKSIIQKDRECYLCSSTLNLEKHHCLHGRGVRQLADRWGLWVWLCPMHHRHSKYGVHGNKDLDLWFKQLAQNCFEIVWGHDRWMEVFKRNYL